MIGTNFSSAASYVCNVGTAAYPASFVSVTRLLCSVSPPIYYAAVSVSMKLGSSSVTSNLITLANPVSAIGVYLRTNKSGTLLAGSLYQLPPLPGVVLSDLACVFSYRNRTRILAPVQTCASFAYVRSIRLFSTGTWDSSCCRVPAAAGTGVAVSLLHLPSMYRKLAIISASIADVPISGTIGDTVAGVDENSVTIYGNKQVAALNSVSLSCWVVSSNSTGLKLKADGCTWKTDRLVLNFSTSVPELTFGRLYLSDSPNYGVLYSAGIRLSARMEANKVLSASTSMVLLGERLDSVSLTVLGVDLSLGYRVSLGGSRLDCFRALETNTSMLCKLDKSARKITEQTGIYQVSLTTPGNNSTIQAANITVVSACAPTVASNTVAYFDNISVTAAYYYPQLYDGRLYCSLNGEYMVALQLQSLSGRIARLSCVPYYSATVMGLNQSSAAATLELWYISSGYKQSLLSTPITVLFPVMPYRLNPALAQQDQSTGFVVVATNSSSGWAGDSLSILVGSRVIPLTKVNSTAWNFTYKCQTEFIQTSLLAGGKTIGTAPMRCVQLGSISTLEYAYNATALTAALRVDNASLNVWAGNQLLSDLYCVLNETRWSGRCEYGSGSMNISCVYDREIVATLTEGRTSASIFAFGQYSSPVRLTGTDFAFTHMFPWTISDPATTYMYTNNLSSVSISLGRANFLADPYCQLNSTSSPLKIRAEISGFAILTCYLGEYEIPENNYTLLIGSYGNPQLLSRNSKSLTVLPPQYIIPQRAYVKLANDSLAKVRITLNYVRHDLDIGCAWHAEPANGSDEFGLYLYTSGTVPSENVSEVDCAVPSSLNSSEHVGRYRLRVSQTQTQGWTDTYQLVEVVPNVRISTVSTSVVNLDSRASITVLGDFSSFLYACGLSAACECVFGNGTASNTSFRASITELSSSYLTVRIATLNVSALSFTATYPLALVLNGTTVNPPETVVFTLYVDEGIAWVRPTRLFSLLSASIYVRLLRHLVPAEISDSKLRCAISRLDGAQQTVHVHAEVLNSTFVRCPVPVLAQGTYGVDVVLKYCPSRSQRAARTITVESPVRIVDVSPSSGGQAGGTYLNVSGFGFDILELSRATTLYCVFGKPEFWSAAMIYTGRLVICVTPKMRTSGKVKLWLASSLSDDEVSASTTYVNTNSLVFKFTPTVTVRDLTPRAVVLGSETTLHFNISTTGELRSAVQCKFANSAIGYTLFVDAVLAGSGVRCTFTPTQRVNYTVSLYIDSAEYSSAYSLTLLDPLRIVAHSPSVVASYPAGGRKVTLTIDNLCVGCQAFCVFTGGAQLAKFQATVARSSSGLRTLTCRTPALAQNVTYDTLQVLDSTYQTLSTNSVPVSYVESPFLLYSEPVVAFVDNSSPIQITVRGTNLAATYLHMQYKDIVLRSTESSGTEASFTLPAGAVSEPTVVKYAVSHFSDYDGSGTSGTLRFFRLPTLTRLANLPLFTQDKGFAIVGRDLDQVLGCVVTRSVSSENYTRLSSATLLTNTSLMCTSNNPLGTLIGAGEISIGVLLSNGSAQPFFGISVTIFALPTLTGISPARGPITGGYNLTLTLDSKPSNVVALPLYCAIGGKVSGPAAVQTAATTFVCLMPAAAGLGNVTVTLITAKGRYLQSAWSGVFMYTPVLRVTSVYPKYYPVSSTSINMTVHGRGFSAGYSSLVCVLRSIADCGTYCALGWGSLSLTATVLTDETINCYVSPADELFLRVGPAELTLADQEGVDIASAPVAVYAYSPPSVEHAEIQKFSANFSLLLRGNSLYKYPRMSTLCAYNVSYVDGSSTASVVDYVGDDSQGFCDLGISSFPLEPTAFTFSLIFNREFQATENISLESPSPGVVLTCTPTKVAARGLETIEIAGNFLKSSESYICWFGSVSTIAIVVNSMRAECTAPELPAGIYQFNITTASESVLYTNTIEFAESVLVYNASVTLNHTDLVNSQWVLVNGTGFVSSCVCVFDENITASAVTYVNSTMLACRLPSVWTTALPAISVAVSCGPFVTEPVVVMRVLIDPLNLEFTPGALREGDDAEVVVVYTQSPTYLNYSVFPVSCKYDCQGHSLIVAANMSLTGLNVNCSIPFGLFNFSGSTCQLSVTIGYMTYNLTPNITVMPRLRLNSVLPGYLIRGKSSELSNTLTVVGGTFLASSEYYCVLSSIVSVSATFVNSTTLTCVVPSANSNVQTIVMYVSERMEGADDLQTSDEFTLSLVDSPTIVSIDPLYVPMNGGYTLTISGTNFVAAKTYVLFSESIAILATVLSTTSLQVSTPRFNSGKWVPVAVTTMLGSESTAATDAILASEETARLELIVVPTLLAVNASILSTVGSESVTVLGRDFTQGSGLHTCLWNWTTSASAETTGTFVSSDYILCSSPTAGIPEGKVTLRVGYRSKYYSSTSLSVSVYTPISVLSVSPTTASRSGGATITVYLSRLPYNMSRTVYCKIADIVDSAVSINSTIVTVRCRVPFIQTSGSYAVEVLQDSGKFTASGVLLTVTEETVVYGISPSLGPAEGGSSVAVNGSNFLSTLTYTCVFSTWVDGRTKTFTSTASRTSSTMLACTTPAVSLKNIYTRFTVNTSNSEVAVGAGMFYHYRMPTVSGFWPRNGTMSGGTNVTVRGTNLLSFLSVLCRFGDLSPVAATIVQEDSLVLCTAPVSSE